MVFELPKGDDEIRTVDGVLSFRAPLSYCPAFRILGRLFVALLLCTSFFLGRPVGAQELVLSEMDSKSWTARDGAPQGITALAQAPDGVLWIGTESGLFKFDGRTFTPFQPLPGEAELPGGQVRTVLATRDGAIWVGFRYGVIGRILGARVKLYTHADGLRILGVKSIQQAADGTLWALRNQSNLIRFGADGTWHVEPSPLGDGGGRLHDFFIDSSDTLWVAQGGLLYRRPLSQLNYLATQVRADYTFGFAEASDHSLWINDSITNAPGRPVGRTQHIDVYGKVIARLPDDTNLEDILYAPDGSLIMLPTAGGILRLSAQALTAQSLAGKRVQYDTYLQNNGLSPGLRKALLFDGDGNLWVGGQRGLDRFRRARLIPFNPPPGAANSARDLGISANLCAGSDGVVWINADHSELYKISGRTTELFHTNGQIYSMSCESSGTPWLVGNDGLFYAHEGRITRLPHIPDSRPSYADQAVALPDHTLVVTGSFGGTQFGGLWRYASDGWTMLAGPDNISTNPTVEYADTRGRLWLGYPDGQLALPLEGKRKLLSSGDPGLGGVFAILETSHGLLASGLNGLAVFRGDRFEILDFADRGTARGISGMVEGANGDLWLNAQRGVLRIAASELQAALKNEHLPMKTDFFTEGDFVGSIGLRQGRSTAARDTQGNLWFLTMNGVFHIDPRNLSYRGNPPNLSILSITMDSRMVDRNRAISPGAQTLDIQYLGVNLTTPDKVIYRYLLEGFETHWQDVGHRAEAIYTRLRPGQYSFRVMASNGDGVWTAPVSFGPFTILPLFYQTPLFAILCVVAILALIWAVYMLRLHQLRRRDEVLNQARLEFTHVARLATLSAMTASIAHEVSQPISGVLTNSNTCVRMLASNPPNIEGATETVRRTIRDANRAHDVIKRLRAMFSKKAPTIESVDLNEAAQEVIAFSSTELQRSGSLLQTELAESLPAVRGDRVQLQQVILNLLLNAADAMTNINDRPDFFMFKPRSRIVSKSCC